jgi:RNA polymerase sigma-70 factor (ECF subfamily)
MARGATPPPAAENQQPQAASIAADITPLVHAHHAAVYRYACRLCGCPNEAEDLTQQTFLIAQQKLQQLREPERACSWLLAVVRSCFLKSLRKTRPIPAQDVDLIVEHVADKTPEVEEIDREELAAGLAELPDEFRLVLLMFYFENLPYQEIAEQLDVPIGTVMSRLSRAKGHLRRRLAPAEANDHKPAPVPRPMGKSVGEKTAGVRAAP